MRRLLGVLAALAALGIITSQADAQSAAFRQRAAGSGALGIEAISRGASQALFVERDRRVVSVLRGNLKDMDLTGCTTARQGDVARVLAKLGSEGCRFDFVFAVACRPGKIKSRVAEP